MNSDCQFYFEIYRGDTYLLEITWLDENNDPIDLTGYTALMQFRLEPDSPDPPLLSITDGNGITLGGTTGVVTVQIDGSDTTSNTPHGSWGDIEVTSPTGVVTTLLKGRVNLDLDVSRN